MLKLPKLSNITFSSHKLFLHTSAIPNPNSSFQHHTLHFWFEKCSSMRHLKSLHSQIIRRGLTGDLITLSHLISLCALSSFGDLHYAHHLFDETPQPNRHMYNTLIRAFSIGKHPGNAIALYRKMVLTGVFPNEFTFPFILKACAFRKAYLEGTSVHVHAVKLGFHESHVCVQNGLMNFYAGCGRIECAQKIFDRVEFRTLVSWNSMIGGYAKMGLWEEAFSILGVMFDEGVEPDGHTLVSLISVCSRIHDEELGKSIHWYIEINGDFFADVYVQNALLDMYAKCGDLQMAESVFSRMVNKNVVSWTSMVSAYSKHGLVELAEMLFNQMPVKNAVSWNSMISCYLQNGHHKESLDLFYRMCDSCETPDENTLVSALSACGELGDLASGKKMHEYLRGNILQPTVTLCNSLIGMYAKCGSAELSLDVFRKIPDKNIVSWNTIINALALHGFGYKAIELFREMEAGGVKPDAFTFTGLLSACCHCGLVEIGRYYFIKMANMYKIPYDAEHYACMVDMLGRGGLLKEALELVGKMGMKPDVVVWGALLGACRIHQNVMVAKVVLKHVLEMEPHAAGLYVLMANIFGEGKKWEELKKMRKLMKDHQVRKRDAISSIELDGCVSNFVAGDKRHGDCDRVYTLLGQLKGNLEFVNGDDASCHSSGFIDRLDLSSSIMESQL